jgi:hypothetical protein
MREFTLTFGVESHNYKREVILGDIRYECDINRFEKAYDLNKGTPLEGRYRDNGSVISPINKDIVSKSMRFRRYDENLERSDEKNFVVLHGVGIYRELNVDGDGKHSVYLERMIEIKDHGLPEWDFFEYDDLPKFHDFEYKKGQETPEQREENDDALTLINMLVEWQDTVDRGEFDSLKPEFEKYQKEKSIAFYKEMKNPIEDMEFLCKYHDGEPIFNMERMQRHPNKKLITVISNKGKSFLSCNYDGMGRRYQALFARKDGKWQVVR